MCHLISIWQPLKAEKRVNFGENVVSLVFCVCLNVLPHNGFITCTIHLMVKAKYVNTYVYIYLKLQLESQG